VLTKRYTKLLAAGQLESAALLICLKVVQHGYGNPKKIARLPNNFGTFALSAVLPAPTLDVPACTDVVHQIADMEFTMNNQASESDLEVSAPIKGLLALAARTDFEAQGSPSSIVGYQRCGIDVSLPRIQIDSLTGLHSRIALREKLANSSIAANPLGDSVALILLDLDGFRKINDAHGQNAGDLCLRQVGHQIVATLGTDIFVARMGEDEFAVLVEGPARRSLNDVVKRITDAIQIPVHFAGQTLQLTSSIGIALRCDGRCFNPDQLIRDTELALLEAKASGGNCHRAFRRILRETCNEKSETLRGMRRALAAGQLELYYQPKIRLCDGVHLGFEALLRWNKPDGPVLSPGSFMAALEDPALSMEIGDFVIASAIDQARRWRIAHVPFSNIAINLSANQFRDSRLANRILSGISAAGLCPSAIEVEVTEGVILSASADGILSACKTLKQGGVRIAFDDFGTGFASLAHLRDFPVDVIKIDRSFISELGQGETTTTIVNAIVALAHNLSMTIVAEGVETQAQVDFLRAIGCDAAQGYLFGYPLPAAAPLHLEQLYARTSPQCVK
jgi:diguanylate cyclase (GGDEF)-like protein